jgi:hypothetical protein
MGSDNVRSIASAPRDDRRKALDQDARVLFIRGMRAKGWDTTRAARECGGSPDSVEAWISGKRRVPGRALVAVGVVVDAMAGRRAA